MSIEWIEESTAKPSGGIRFLDEEIPAKPDEVAARVDDPSYFPTKEEFRVYREHKKSEPFWKPGKWAVTAYDSAVNVLSDLTKGGKAILKGDVSPIGDLQQSILEGAARGTYDLGMLGRSIMQKIPGYADDLNEAQFIQGKIGGLNQEAFPNGITPATTLLTRTDVPEATMKQWKDEYANYKTDRDYDRFLIERVLTAGREQARQGKENLLPDMIGKANPEVSEALSYVLDPSMAIPGGGIETKLLPKTILGKQLPRRFSELTIPGAVESLESVAAKGLGYTAEEGGRKLQQGTQWLGRPLEFAMESTEDTPFQTVLKPVIATAKYPLAIGASVGKAAESGGQAARAIGEKVAEGTSQFGTLERIAKDDSKPAWLRKSARIGANLGGDTLLNTAGTVAGGAVEGAAVGAGLGLIANGPEGAAAGIGSGGVLGGGGSLVGRYLGRDARRVEAEDADIGRFLRKQASLGTDPESLAKLNRETALAAATADQIFGGAVDVRFANGEDYAKRSGDGLGAAFFDSGDSTRKPQIVINLDAAAKDYRSNLLHEVGHALFKSPVVNKSEISSALYGVYGEDGIRAAADEYARKFLLNRKSREGIADAEKTITPEEITATKLELAKRDPDWILGEIFAEQFLDTTFDQSLDRLRKGKAPQGTSSDAAEKAVLDAKGNVLDAMGVPLDSAGNIAGGKRGVDRLFSELQIRNDPKLSKMIRNYLRDRDRFLSGLSVVKESKEKGAPIAPKDLVNHPAAGWRWNPEGYWETDFAILVPEGSPAAAQLKTVEKRGTLAPDSSKVKIEPAEEKAPATKQPETAPSKPQPILEPEKPSGKVILKDPKSIEAVERKRVTDLSSLFSDQPLLPLDDPRLGRKEKPNGERETRGRILPEGFFQLASFSDETKRIAKALQDAMGTGDVFNGWYHQIGTGTGKDSWAQSVRKGLGNLRVSQRDFKPMSFFVSQTGNLLVTVLDVSSVLRKAVRWQTEGKLNGTWGGDLNLFHQDLEKYLKNHADGLPGDANGLGTQKKNELNAFFGVTDKASDGFNPLRVSLRGEDKKSLVKSFRIDRLESVEKTGRDNFWFDYDKQKRNLLPDHGRRNISTEILQLANEAPQISSGRKWVEIGAVTPETAAKIRDALALSNDPEAQGMDVSRFRHTIDNSAINHIFKRHGNQAGESLHGQVAVTKDDLLRIPEILSNPDKVEYEGRNRLGQIVIKYTKRFSGTTFYCEEIRTGKRELAAATMYKMKTGPRR